MYTAYKYVRDKRRAAKAAPEAEAAGMSLGSHPDRDADSQTTVPPARASPTPHTRISSSLKWKLMLMAALFVPVFFETVDYTGEHRTYRWCGYPGTHQFVQLLRPLKST